MHPSYTKYMRLTNAFLNGGCDTYAIALSKVTGWPIQAATQTGLDGLTYLAHAWVKAPNGSAYDASGQIDLSCIREKYFIDSDWQIQEVSQHELSELQNIAHQLQNASLLEEAMKMATVCAYPQTALFCAASGVPYGELSTQDTKAILFSMVEHNPDLFSSCEELQDLYEELDIKLSEVTPAWPFDRQKQAC